jgi:single-strand DNA-binding protein
MNETMVTVVGNLVDDPRLRVLDSGREVANFRIASTSRRWDRDTEQYVDSGQLFLSVSCWRALASNVSQSLRKGDPVVVTGKLTTRSYEKDGQNRSVCELEGYAVGPDLGRGTAVFRRSPRPVPDDGPYGSAAGGYGPDPDDTDGDGDAAADPPHELLGAGM